MYQEEEVVEEDEKEVVVPVQMNLKQGEQIEQVQNTWRDLLEQQAPWGWSHICLA